MIDQPAYTDSQFHCRVTEQRPLHLLDHLARDKAADSKAAHVDAEREHLPVAGVAQEQFEVTGPGTFVDESRETRKGEEEIDENVHI